MTMPHLMNCAALGTAAPTTASSLECPNCKRLREALQPFAWFAGVVPLWLADDVIADVFCLSEGLYCRRGISLGQCRQAKEALNGR